MTGRRDRGALTGSRIYVRGRRFYLFARAPLLNPITGRVARWHSLCPVEEGEQAAQEAARRILDANGQRSASGAGDMPQFSGLSRGVMRWNNRGWFACQASPAGVR